MNANDATLTVLATAHTGSTVPDTAPNAPDTGTFDLVLDADRPAAPWAAPAPPTP